MNSHVGYHDGYDALARMCEGHASDEIAYHLIHTDGVWQGKELQSGATRVRSCLSRTKDEFFKLAELLAIMRFTQRYDPLYFACDQLGLSRPVVLSTEMQLEKIHQAVHQAGETLAVVLLLLEKSNVVPGKQKPVAKHFSLGRVT